MENGVRYMYDVVSSPILSSGRRAGELALGDPLQWAQSRACRMLASFSVTAFGLLGDKGLLGDTRMGPKQSLLNARVVLGHRFWVEVGPALFEREIDPCL